MGDSDGSSNAAQGARSEANSKPGLIGRVLQALRGTSENLAGPTSVETAPLGESGSRSLANLTRLRVEDVMIPKVEIVAASMETDEAQLLEIFRQSGLTRLPIYVDTMDTPMGLVHLKDFALKHGFNGGQGAFDLKAMLRPLLYAPPSMPIGVLLQKMQTDRTHMALVIDEYGGVDGLVTIEDLIEPVIGEFEAELGKKLILEDEEDEIDTLGGLIVRLAGRVPARGEVVKHPDGLDFEVVDADPRRIKRLRVRTGAATQQAAE
jgi:magnesium and cobalt transporter